MLLVLILFLCVTGCLVLVKQLPMSLYDVSDGITAHVYHTLWQSHLCMSRLLFYSHHSLCCVFFPHPVETKNWREDLHVVVCPWVCYWVYCPCKAASKRYCGITVKVWRIMRGGKSKGTLVFGLAARVLA